MSHFQIGVPLLTISMMIFSCGHAEDFSANRPQPSTQVGAACNNDADCDQYCAKGGKFPGGFCTIHRCRSNRDCPDGTVCITEDKGVCAFPCAVPLDCTADFMGRAGYTCLEKSAYQTTQATSVKYSVCIGSN